MDPQNYPQAWTERVGGFSTAVGKTIEEITTALAPVVGEPTEEALQLLSNSTVVPDNDIKEALKGLNIPSGKFNMNLVKLRGENQKDDESTGSTKSQLSILPNAPDEESFLTMLRTGGVLKVDKTAVISAVKAAFAKIVGLYNLPKMMMEKMEEFSVKQEEPSSEDFYEMERLLNEKKYGDILSVLKVSGTHVNEARKKDFFSKVQAKLWPVLFSFNKQLSAWREEWMKGAGNPAMMIMALTANQKGGAVPQGLMDPPDTTPVHTAAEDVVNEINRIFAGPAIPVARALAYDATRIMTILKKDKLPMQMGYANKDQMLKDLSINVGSDIIRLEQAVTRYTLAVMSLSEITPDDEVLYLSALIQLGSSIPWEKFQTETGLGSRTAL
mgnify:CR=1 FL=1